MNRGSVVAAPSCTRGGETDEKLSVVSGRADRGGGDRAGGRSPRSRPAGRQPHRHQHEELRRRARVLPRHARRQGSLYGSQSGRHGEAHVSATVPRYVHRVAARSGRPTGGYDAHRHRDRRSSRPVLPTCAAAASPSPTRRSGCRRRGSRELPTATACRSRSCRSVPTRYSGRPSRPGSNRGEVW